eukprot:COSAG01_NODE_3787_length_5693_cov_17.714337_3_plen_58_part_00
MVISVTASVLITKYLPWGRTNAGQHISRVSKPVRYGEQHMFEDAMAVIREASTDTLS